ncbi:RnfH family protein [Chitinivorax sp. B]|uniref:RnfH family protein n=1 Tax=Chitinivorax sp. B TaxID=2502235 RepID=UPI0010F946C7|nr:RnfH family protein [Chitinivorax sp. B]
MNSLRIEVVYALPQQQTLLSLTVPAGTTAQQAIAMSGLFGKHPELQDADLKLGIFARPIASDTVLRDCDRVEVYRPLIADPKTVRRQRAESVRAAGKKKTL